jgi:ATP-binding cassette subfamily F protein uup
MLRDRLEPADDLVIETLTVLEDYLDDFPGVVLAVSHDRYFLDRMAERIFVFDGAGHITKHTGNYFDYLEDLKVEMQAKASTQTVVKSVDKVLKDEKNAVKEKPLKFSFKEQREFETIDNDILELENSIEEINSKIEKAAADYVALKTLLSEKEELEKQLEFKMERWVYLNDLAEKIESAKNK